MVSFDCDPAVILAAKERLESNASSDPADYLCRVFLFCQSTEDDPGESESLEARVTDVCGNTGLMIRYESSTLLVLENTSKKIDCVLKSLRSSQRWTSYVCSSEEGVERIFSDLRTVVDSGAEKSASDFEIKDYDEIAVVNAIARITYELLENAEPNTVNMDKCLARIVANARKFLFTVHEFLDEFDIKTHICRAIEADETPQMENLIIEDDTIAAHLVN